MKAYLVRDPFWGPHGIILADELSDKRAIKAYWFKKQIVEYLHQHSIHSPDFVILEELPFFDYDQLVPTKEIIPFTNYL